MHVLGPIDPTCPRISKPMPQLLSLRTRAGRVTPERITCCTAEASGPRSPRCATRKLLQQRSPRSATRQEPLLATTGESPRVKRNEYPMQPDKQVF